MTYPRGEKGKQREMQYEYVFGPPSRPASFVVAAVEPPKERKKTRVEVPKNDAVERMVDVVMSGTSSMSIEGEDVAVGASRKRKSESEERVKKRKLSRERSIASVTPVRGVQLDSDMEVDDDVREVSPFNTSPPLPQKPQRCVYPKGVFDLMLTCGREISKGKDASLLLQSRQKSIEKATSKEREAPTALVKAPLVKRPTPPKTSTRTSPATGVPASNVGEKVKSKPSKSSSSSQGGPSSAKSQSRAVVRTRDPALVPRIAAPKKVSPEPVILGPKSSRFELIAADMRQQLANRSFTMLHRNLDKLMWSYDSDDITPMLIDHPAVNFRALVRIISRMPGDTLGARELRQMAKRLLRRWDDKKFDRDPYERWVGLEQRTRVGNMGFIVGEVFIDREALITSGIHQAQMSGIVGRVEDGAHSIVISGGNQYDDTDRDLGYTLWYSGTISRNPDEMTRNTALLDESYRRGTASPIRVLRTSKCTSTFAPQKGVRFDGMYYIQDRRRVNIPGSPGENFKYLLRRFDGQEDIFQGFPTGRETAVLTDAELKRRG